jgi:penicillin amidase
VEAKNEVDMYWGQGYVHATDRGMQLLFMRILGQGRVSELLDSSDESLQIDIFFRRMNWVGRVQEQIDNLSEKEHQILDSYSAGLNAALAQKVPWELKTLLGYRPEKWRGEDTVLLTRMLGYLTLVQSQAEIERLFVELVQAGIGQEKLEALFPGILGGLDIDLLNKVTLNEKIVTPLLWNKGVPRMMASNNWVIAGTKTASGHAILSNDVHLETNRLPNIWCEILLKADNAVYMGGSMPGMPGILSGRTADVAWGLTYSFIDALDSWMERCKDGQYYREEGEQWLDFQTRKEVIQRKKKDAVEVTFYENEHGVLDGDPRQEGIYLATRWAAAESGATALSGLLRMGQVKTVAEGMDALGQIKSGWDFVLADRAGNIGFQMSGLVPRRREGVSGFVPLPGWKKENDWLGFYSHEDMPRIMNPEEGFFATANHDLNRYGRIQPINMPMGAYRASRISQLLEQGEAFTLSDMYKMHYDVYSLQAEYFMHILRPLLPDTPQGEILSQWDLCYDADSQGAYLFEQFYKALYREVFGKNGFGETVVDYLAEETGAFIDFYENFDRVLLAEESPWFGQRSREEIYRQAAEKALVVEPKRWKEVQQFKMDHILLGGKMPGFFGFDRGPLTAIGSRATIHQGQLYRSAGRMTSFLPSFRIVSDMGQEEVFTNLAGGPSDRRFSKWYCSDLENWIKGSYKRIRADAERQGRFP